jgi:hypothetical protein
MRPSGRAHAEPAGAGPGPAVDRNRDGRRHRAAVAGDLLRTCFRRRQHRRYDQGGGRIERHGVVGVDDEHRVGAGLTGVVHRRGEVREQGRVELQRVLGGVEVGDLVVALEGWAPAGSFSVGDRE